MMAKINLDSCNVLLKYTVTRVSKDLKRVAFVALVALTAFICLEKGLCWVSRWVGVYRDAGDNFYR